MAIEHIPGMSAGKIMLYALSTCVWCKKTRRLLDELGVEYDYQYVDLEEGKARDDAEKGVTRWNPDNSFPTLVINGKCIVGFKEEEIRKTLK